MDADAEKLAARELDGPVDARPWARRVQPMAALAEPVALELDKPGAARSAAQSCAAAEAVAQSAGPDAAQSASVRLAEQQLLAALAVWAAGGVHNRRTRRCSGTASVRLAAVWEPEL